MENKTRSEPKTTKNTNIVNCAPKLVNVLFPGVVKNVDKALRTLGGIKNIESVTTASKKHLELSFRPHNLCSKPVLSDRDTKPHVLLKIKTRKSIKDGKVVDKEVLDYDVVGLTAVNLKFTKLCDFQYLPLVSKVPKEVEEDLIYIYDDIVPKKLLDADWLNNEDLASMPLYFVPYQFSKPNMTGNRLQFDRSKFYEGRFMQQYCDKFKETQLQQKMLRKDRDKFTKTTMLVRIEDDVPQTPNAQALAMVKEKGFSEVLINKLKTLFEERAIWSRNALFYYSRASSEQMKYILPTIAYHYVSGPWRVMWVRLGYDPKVDPAAKMLQTFDYRVRSRGGSGKIKIRTKRYATLTNRSLPDNQGKFLLSNVANEPKTRAVPIEENSFLLRPGLLPAARQTFFQYCDVKLPEIENMFTKLPTVLPGSILDWKHGWLPNGFADHCREIVNTYINDLVSKEMRDSRKNNSPKVSSDSASESSTSDSEISEGADEVENTEAEDVIDLETVEEINQLLGMRSSPSNVRNEEMPGPSSAS